MPRRLVAIPVLAAAVATVGLAGPLPALADDAPTSQRLDLDAGPPMPAFVSGVDVLGPVFGRYEARLEAAVDRWHAVGLDIGAQLDRGLWRARVLVGWQLWPLCRGLRGPWAGVFVGAIAGAGRAPWGVPLRVEAGYQGVWGDVAVGLAASTERDLRAANDPWRLRLGLYVSWVLRGD